MSSKFRFVLGIAAIALIGALATCVDHQTPTSSADQAIADSQATASLISSSITHTLLTAGNDPVNKRVYSTAPIAPAPNTLITVAVLGRQVTGVGPSPTLSGGGMTAWTEVATVTFDPLSLPTRRLTIFRAMSAAPGSGPLTITFTGDALGNCQWIVSQWGGVDESGVNGAGAIGQTGTNRGDAVSGLTVPLGALGNAANVTYGAFGVASNLAVVTPGAGFTEIAEQPSGESTPGDLQAEWGTNLNPIAATWASRNAGALGVEIKAAATGGPGGVSASLSTVAAAPASIMAGNGSSTITVTVKDASGNPISGATVVLSSTGTGNTLTQPAGPTDDAGVATGTLSSTMAESKTISAKANGTAITQTAAVTVTPGPVSASQSTVAAEPTSIGPGGTSTITVTAKDEFGNPISGATVVLAATGSGSSLTQPASPTNASGVATGTLSSTLEETIVVSATIANVAITQTATVMVMMHAPATISHTLLTAGNDAVNRRVYTTVSIAPAPNALITVAVLGRKSSGASPSPTLSGGGMTAWTEVATATFDPLSLPTRRLTIYRAMSATPGSGPLTITFSGGSQGNCQWIVSQWTGVDESGVNGAGAIGQTGANRSDAVNGLTVPLGALGSAANVAYGAFGVASKVAVVTPGAGFTEIAEQPSGESTPGDLEAEWATNDNTIDGTWGVLKNSSALGVEIKAGSAGAGTAVVSVDVTPASADILVGGTVQLTATPRNAEGEPLSGRTVAWMSDAPAVATVSPAGLVTGTGAGSATITATSEGVSGTASVTVTTSTEPVAAVEVVPTSATVSVGGMVQLTATAKDAAGQPLPGRTFTWATDAVGVATVSGTGLVSGVAEGSATITATSEGKTGTASVTVTAGGQASQVGQWSAVFSSPLILIHTHLMPDGRVLIFGRTGAQVWDPVTGTFTDEPSPSLVFCSGHGFLPDGRLLVSGGGGGDGLGLLNTNIFDPGAAAWIVGPSMAQGRWYPTVTTLPNGEVLTTAGQDQNGIAVPIPEVWDGTNWRQLTTASMTLPNYPRMFVAPDGRLYYAGAGQQTRFLDVTGTGAWTDGPMRQFGGRSYGPAVMYQPGKILYVGGGSPPTNTAEIIDLNQQNPQWTATGSLTYARAYHNATVLPTGEVLVTGGTSGDRSNPALAINVAEIWNPTSGSWSTLPSSAPLLRGYHSTSILLPDGRVLHGGGGGGGGTVDNYNYEVYSPAYLFKGTRPSITGATPATVGYGQTVTIGTSDGASVTKVVFIRAGSVTHAFDQSQRLVPLDYSPVPGGLSVTLPGSRTVAPPGPYMLFLVNGNGVPSVARIMVLQ